MRAFATSRNGAMTALRSILRRLASRPQRFGDIAAAALVLTAIVLTLQSIVVSFATHSILPQEDEWFSLTVLRSILNGGHVLADVFSQHNEHRIAFPRLILFSDYLFFKGEGYFDLTVIVLMQGLVVGLLIDLLRRSGPVQAGSIAIGAMVPLLLFSLRQEENFVWGFQVTFVSVFAAASLAIVLFAKALEPSRADGASTRLALTSYALVGVATFSMSNGLLGGIVLIIMALLARAPKRHVVGAILSTAVMIAAFSFHYEFLGGAELRAQWLQHPWAVVRYASAYLGNFLDPNMRRAIGFGGAGLIAAVVLVARFALGHDRDPTRLALLGIAMFTAGSALLTALGRFTDGIGGAMASRYATGAGIFWSAILICGWSLSVTSRYRIALRLALAAACLLLVVKIVAIQAPGVSALHNMAFTRRRMEDALVQGLVDEPALTGSDNDVALVREVLPMLRERALSIFASDNARLLGRPLAVAGAVDTAPCWGTFDTALGVPALGTNGVHVTGTTGIRHLITGSDRIVIVGPEQTIVGFASTPFGAPNWEGYATAALSTPLTAFIRLGSHRLCELGTAQVSSGDAAVGAGLTR